MSTEAVAGRPIELEQIEVETIRIRILPNGRMDRENAAKYLNRKPKTLAMWSMQGKGPTVHRAGGRVFYYREELDRFIAEGDAPSTPEPQPQPAAT